MEGLTDVTQRIAEIRGRIASVSAPFRAPAGAFASALSTAVGAATSATSTTSSSTLGGATTALSADGLAGSQLRRTAKASTAMNADGVPVALAAHGNGRIPESALAPVGVGKHQLWAPAAEGFQRMSAAAKADGVTIGITDSYRSYDQQVDVAKRKGLYSEGGLAAKPGTSDHGWGRATDLDLDPKALTWMRAHGAEFGFVEDVPREPWHWTFTPPA